MQYLAGKISSLIGLAAAKAYPWTPTVAADQVFHIGGAILSAHRQIPPHRWPVRIHCRCRYGRPARRRYPPYVLRHMVCSFHHRTGMRRPEYEGRLGLGPWIWAAASQLFVDCQRWRLSANAAGKPPAMARTVSQMNFEPEWCDVLSASPLACWLAERLCM